MPKIHANILADLENMIGPWHNINWSVYSSFRSPILLIFFTYPFLTDSPTATQNDYTERDEEDQPKQPDCPETINENHETFQCITNLRRNVSNLSVLLTVYQSQTEYSSCPSRGNDTAVVEDMIFY